MLKVLHLNGVPIYTFLRIEEAIFRCKNAGSWLVTNVGTPSPSIIMGISGVAEKVSHIEKVKERGVNIIKRYSGGGTVVVSNNTLFVSLIGDQTFLDKWKVKMYPREIMKWTESVYKPVFKESPNFSLLENDYVIGKLKFGGNAQCLSLGRFVHHTSFLLDYNENDMDLLQMPDRAPEYRESRRHSDFLCKLKDHVHLPPSDTQSTPKITPTPLPYDILNYIEPSPFILPHIENTTVEYPHARLGNHLAKRIENSLKELIESTDQNNQIDSNLQNRMGDMAKLDTIQHVDLEYAAMFLKLPHRISNAVVSIE
eukprot:TRINITY_DN4529_c0_g1_i6.p1 TRINITY_DN4529_c0_g1~~TRINITY_DN4529_c0_g1_i6.p1  ORF type:complete len:312 (-),score=57.35 TRINITY_DN4529_c0_g1_i6:24-959(-)